MITQEYVDKVIADILKHDDSVYDPVKAHAYYLRIRKLKGRKLAEANASGSRKVAKAIPLGPNKNAKKQAAAAKIARLSIKLHSLTDALQKAEKALQAKRATAKKNSDGKTTVKERQQSQQYRDTHKSKIAAAEKKAARKTASKSAPKTVDNMTENELTDRISKIKGLISNVQEQIKAANASAKA